MSNPIEDGQKDDVVANDVQRRQQLRRELQHFRTGLYQEAQTLRQDLYHFRCELKRQVTELRLTFRQNHQQISEKLRAETQQYIYHVSESTQSLRRRLRSPQLTDTSVDTKHADVEVVDTGAADQFTATVAETVEKNNVNITIGSDDLESDDTFIKIEQSAAVTDDVWTTVLKEQTERLLKQVVNIELQAFIASYHDHLADDGRQAVVRNGYLPERTIETDLGTLTVRIPKTRDRSGQGIKFNSQLLPPYLKQTQLNHMPLAWWCWYGIAVGDFYPLLQNLLGIENISDSNVLSQAVRERLEAQWRQAYLKRCGRDWSNLYLDHLQATTVWQDADQQGTCCLVIIAVDDQNKLHVLAVCTGESADLEEWKGLLASLHEQGLRIPASTALSKSTGPRAFQEALYNLFPPKVE